jgi:L-lactate dehydrogenase
MTKREKKNRVSIIGCKDFSGENLYSLLMTGAVRELILNDSDCAATFAKLSHLLELIPLGSEAQVRQGTISDAATSDIVVIAANTERRDRESNLDLLTRKVDVVRAIAGELRKHSFNGVILMSSNPVDVLANVVLEESGLPTNQVIGSGMSLNDFLFGKTTGNQALCAENKFENAKQVSAPSTWCAAIACRTKIVDNCQPNCPEFGTMLDADRNEPDRISRKSEISPLAVGTCIPRICEAILRDERTILPVTSMATGQYGINGVYLNQPCVIRRNGVEEVITLRIEEEEKRDLIDSSDILKRINNIYLREAQNSYATLR